MITATLSRVSDRDPIPEFDAFFRRNRGYFVQSAHRIDLPVEDAEQTAWLAWYEASQRWQPTHASGASFNSFALTQFSRLLLRNNERVIRLFYEAPETADTDLPADAPDRFAAAPPHVEDEDALATISHELLEDAVRQHPLFQRENYRPVLDAVLKGLSAAEAASQIGITTRRVLQIVDEAAHRLAQPDPLRDDAFLAGAPSADVSADAVRYRAISELTLPHETIVGQTIIDTATSIIELGIMAPVLIDQYGRVLDGVKRVIACRLLGFTHCRTVLHVIPGPDADLDPPYLRLRARLTGRPTEAARGAGLISDLGGLMACDDQAALNGVRLSTVDPDVQRRLLDEFGLEALGAMRYPALNDIVRAAQSGQWSRVALKARTARTRDERPSARRGGRSA